MSNQQPPFTGSSAQPGTPWKPQPGVQQPGWNQPATIQQPARPQPQPSGQWAQQGQWPPQPGQWPPQQGQWPPQPGQPYPGQQHYPPGMTQHQPYVAQPPPKTGNGRVIAGWVLRVFTIMWAVSFVFGALTSPGAPAGMDAHSYEFGRNTVWITPS